MSEARKVPFIFKVALLVIYALLPRVIVSGPSPLMEALFPLRRGLPTLIVLVFLVLLYFKDKRGFFPKLKLDAYILALYGFYFLNLLLNTLLI